MAWVWQGVSAVAVEGWYPAGDNPPRRGDIIVMAAPPNGPVPPGYTWQPNSAFVTKYADGTETGFPYPAAWFSGAVVAEKEE